MIEPLRCHLPYVPQPCWSCKGPVDPRTLFCDTCGAVQSPGAIDHFTRLGLPVDFKLDPEQLNKQYFAYQRLLHPDRFAARSARERALSQAQAVSLNEAYETLKDPMRRAAYLLELYGKNVEINASASVNDQKLLIEAMEMREELENAPSVADIRAVEARAAGYVKECELNLASAFHENNLTEAGRLTTRLRYLTRLAEEAHNSLLRKNTGDF